MESRKYWWAEVHVGNDDRYGLDRHDARVVEYEHYGTAFDLFGIEETTRYTDTDGDGPYPDIKHLYYMAYKGWSCMAIFHANAPVLLTDSVYEKYKKILWVVIKRFGLYFRFDVKDELEVPYSDRTESNVRVDFNEGDKVMIEECCGSFRISIQNPDPLFHDIYENVVEIPDVPVNRNGWEDVYALKKNFALWIRDELTNRYDDIDKLFEESREERRRQSEKETK